MKTRNEKVKAALHETAAGGYRAGFTTGGRYALSLMMGLPRPSRVILDDELEPGEVAFIANPRTDLQRDRLLALGEFLDAVRNEDIGAVAARGMEIAPDLRLEQIVRLCDSAENSMDRAMQGGGVSPAAWLDEFVGSVRKAARGER